MGVGRIEYSDVSILVADRDERRLPRGDDAKGDGIDRKLMSIFRIGVERVGPINPIIAIFDFARSVPPSTAKLLFNSLNEKRVVWKPPNFGAFTAEVKLRVLVRFEKVSRVFLLKNRRKRGLWIVPSNAFGWRDLWGR